jgi:hypothetical protein
MYIFSLKKFSAFRHRSSLGVKNIHLLLLFFLVVSCGACKKTNTPSYSKFRIQHLDYIAIIYVNSVKLSNGNYLTLDQDIDFLHINLGEYDTWVSDNGDHKQQWRVFRNHV